MAQRALLIGHLLEDAGLESARLEFETNVVGPLAVSRGDTGGPA